MNAPITVHVEQPTGDTGFLLEIPADSGLLLQDEQDIQLITGPFPGAPGLLAVAFLAVSPPPAP